MSELGTCHEREFPYHTGEHPKAPLCKGWTPKQPIPPLVLQAYRALRAMIHYAKVDGCGLRIADEALAAIEAEYPGVKEKA